MNSKRFQVQSVDCSRRTTETVVKVCIPQLEIEELFCFFLISSFLIHTQFLASSVIIFVLPSWMIVESLGGAPAPAKTIDTASHPTVFLLQVVSTDYLGPTLDMEQVFYVGGKPS